MNQLIDVYGKSYAILMDNWLEMTSDKFIKWAKEQGIILMLIQPAKPNQNTFVERFNRSFRDEVLNANLLNSVDQAQEVADDWV
jgi:putative transposase